MGKQPKLSQHEFQVIADHLDNLIVTTYGQLVAYRNRPKSMQLPGHKRTMDYWKDAHAALCWARAIAAQRAGEKGHGGRESVQ